MTLRIQPVCGLARSQVRDLPVERRHRRLGLLGTFRLLLPGTKSRQAVRLGPGQLVA
ncbi:MAG TPA: hypothetical protein VFR40_02610 [Lapillicoccus sp.]|nr:hypothetical protein [Lapillicoccus sp.]